MPAKKILTHHVAKSWINLLSNAKENQNMSPRSSKMLKNAKIALLVTGHCGGFSAVLVPLFWLLHSEVSFHVSHFIFHGFESNKH